MIPAYAFLKLYGVLRGYHPFDPCRGSMQQSQYPYDNNGKLAAPVHSEDLVQRRIVQKVLGFPKEEWEHMELGVYLYYLNVLFIGLQQKTLMV